MWKIGMTIGTALALALSFGMTGCAQDNAGETASSAAQDALVQVASDSGKQTKEQADEVAEKAAAKKAEEEAEREAEIEAKKKFEIGDTVSNDNWDVSLVQAQMCDTVEPLNVANSSSTVTYLEANEGITLVSLVFEVEALTNDAGMVIGDAIGEDYVLKYGDLEYTTAQEQFYSGSGLWRPVWRYTLEPKMPEYVYLTFSIPEEAKNDKEPISLELTAAGQEKVITIR